MLTSDTLHLNEETTDNNLNETMDKEAIVNLLKQQNKAGLQITPPKQRGDVPNQVTIPLLFSSSELPDSVYQKLLSLIEDKNEQVLKDLQDPLHVFSRLQSVSEDYLKGSLLLIHKNLPPRDNTILYRKTLVTGLRFLFSAYASMFYIFFVSLLQRLMTREFFLYNQRTSLQCM
jgi:hypothetical protein